MIKLFIENRNKDHLGTLLMIALKKLETSEDIEEKLRKQLRKHFLSLKDNQ